MSRVIDLNTDAGESYGRWSIVDENELFKYVSSVNIACGFHAGDPLNIWKSVRIAKKYGLGIGAHPGFPDLIGFGRREIEVGFEELVSYIVYQLGALDAFLRVEKIDMQHVKPHGALYNMAWIRDDYAEAIVKAIALYNDELILVSPYGSKTMVKAEEYGLKTAYEAFIDRAYLKNGRLAPRTMPGSVYTDLGKIIEQALLIIDKNIVKTIDGEFIEIRAHTLCIHSDTPGAINIARVVYEKLRENGIELKPMRVFIK